MQVLTHFTVSLVKYEHVFNEVTVEYDLTYTCIWIHTDTMVGYNGHRMQALVEQAPLHF